MVNEMDKRNNMLVLSLGGNIGEVLANFDKATNLVNERIGELTLCSPIYTTKAWGIENQPDFFNQVLVLNTILLPEQVLKNCLAIELELGRVRTQKWYERTIDIDILFYADKIIEASNLTVPHPYLHKRNFVLFPLSDVIPNFMHPILNLSIEDIKKECKDNLPVAKYFP